MRLPIIACCLLLVAAAPAAAQNWTYARSDHFEVYTTGGDRRARDALTYFERVHAFFADFLKLSPRTTTPTRLIIFSGDRQFAPYRPNAVAQAFYMQGPDRDYIVMGSFDEDAFPVVIHEYAHLIIRHSGDVYPLWLNEGLAEFFSTMKQEGNRMAVGIVHTERLRYLADGMRLMDLDRLFAVGHGSPEYNTQAHAGVFYSQSWALTHMFFTDSRYREHTGRFMDLVVDDTPSAVAIEQAYGRTLDEVTEDLRVYIRQSRYMYLPVDYRSPPAGPRVPTRRAEPFEADLVIANLLANQQRHEAEARAAFERLEAQRPDDLELIESRATFELRHRHTETAQTFLLRAAELDSTNPSIYRQLAILEPGRSEEFLSQAVALAPEDIDLRLHYATVIFRDGRAGQTLSVLRSVTRVPQEAAFHYFQLLANVYLRLDAVDAGRAAALRAAQHADPGDEAEFAARLIRSIDEFVAARQAAAARARRLADATEAPAAAVPAAELSVAPAPFTPGAGVPGQALVITVTGRLQNMVCGADSPVLEVATSSGTLRLRIDDPLAVSVQGTDDGTVDLHCGAQRDVPVRIGYVPALDSARDTVGHVRVLDYRTQ